MITTPTTFVIGAGASKPYGLPLGYDLLLGARNLTPDSPLYQALIDGPDVSVRIQKLNSFREAARQYPGRSIDALLEDQHDHREIGHEVIAGLMNIAISRARAKAAAYSVNAEEDWISYLVDKMRGGARGKAAHFCEMNAVQFVTFNFDSVLEERLRAAVRGLYGTTEGLVLPPIIHVHGTLPDFSLVRAEIRFAAKEIRVIQDELDPAAVASAREALQWAEVICFLGFSYHPDNLQTLNVPGIFRRSTTMPQVFGSALDVFDGESASVNALLGNRVTLGKRDQNSLLFLREYPVLRTK
jgi:hypothetical protein